MTEATATQAAPQPAGSAIPWWLVLLEAIAAIIIGALLLANPAKATFVLIQLLGIYWFISGIFGIVSIFIDKSQWGWKLFSGILGIIAGILIIQHPLWSTLLVPATLVIILGIQGIIIGIVKLIQAFQGAGWGAGILGVLSIILGLFLLANLFWATLSLPFVVGIFAIIGGIFALVAAFQMKAAG
jgi:uncharacterized membrane protein HdeD (DUF308 family)